MQYFWDKYGIRINWKEISYPYSFSLLITIKAWLVFIPACIVTDEDDELQCADGSFCLGDSSDYGSDSWQCCNEKGGRVGCPPNHPNLCAAENACGNGTALCCEVDCTNFGGDRPCGKLENS